MRRESQGPVLCFLLKLSWLQTTGYCVLKYVRYNFLFFNRVLKNNLNYCGSLEYRITSIRRIIYLAVQLCTLCPIVLSRLSVTRLTIVTTKFNIYEETIDEILNLNRLTFLRRIETLSLSLSLSLCLRVTILHKLVSRIIFAFHLSF